MATCHNKAHKHQATCTPQTCAFTEVTAKTQKKARECTLREAVTTLQRRPKKQTISELCKTNRQERPNQCLTDLPRNARKHNNSVRDQHFQPRLNCELSLIKSSHLQRRVAHAPGKDDLCMFFFGTRRSSERATHPILRPYVPRCHLTPPSPLDRCHILSCRLPHPTLHEFRFTDLCKRGGRRGSCPKTCLTLRLGYCFAHKENPQLPTHQMQR